MLRCAELCLSWEMLGELTVGMVFDMYTEKANDREEYPYVGTAEDLERMFPA